MRAPTRGALAVAVLVAGLAGCAGDGGGDDAGGDPGVPDDTQVSYPAETCEPYQEFRAIELAQRVALEPQDPRLAIAALRDVELPPDTPQADVDDWGALIEAQEGMLIGASPRVVELPELYFDLGNRCAHQGEPVDPGVSTEDPEVPPFPAPTGGGGLEVVEQGLTGITEAPGYELASFAVVLENTTDEVVVRAQLDVALVDEHGESVVDEERAPTPYIIPVIRPGERFGIGDTVYVDRPGVAALEASAVSDPGPGSMQWWPAEHDLVEFPEIALEPPATVRHDDGTVTVELSYESAYGVLLGQREAFVVFRDGAGAIVGGAKSRFDVRPGHGFGEITRSGPAVPGVDDTRSEVFL